MVSAEYDVAGKRRERESDIVPCLNQITCKCVSRPLIRGKVTSSQAALKSNFIAVLKTRSEVEMRQEHFSS